MARTGLTNKKIEKQSFFQNDMLLCCFNRIIIRPLEVGLSSGLEGKNGVYVVGMRIMFDIEGVLISS